MLQNIERAIESVSTSLDQAGALARLTFAISVGNVLALLILTFREALE